MAHDVVVIGAGQAGLAVGQGLTAAGRDVLLLDGASALGESWRRRWDSLRLFTPVRRNGLPGLPFPGAPDHYPGKDAVADYLAAYAEHFALPVQLGRAVTSVRGSADGYTVVSAAETVTTRQVVVATGPFQRPHLPPHELTIPNIHTAEYCNPAVLPPGPVVVVGAGNSGVQIAAELAGSREVTLAVSRRPKVLPQRLLGGDIFDWLDRLGLVTAASNSRIGARVAKAEPVIGTTLKALRRRGVRLVGRVVTARGAAVTTSCGAVIEAGVVVWATGYRPDYRWLDVSGALTGDGLPLHDRGRSPVRGLSYIGLPYQRSRGSALLGWVGNDARDLVRSLTAT